MGLIRLFLASRLKYRWIHQGTLGMIFLALQWPGMLKVWEEAHFKGFSLEWEPLGGSAGPG